jgi:4-diphosphocytidyl-2-C-methyl-D-erythritol kinase
LNLIPDLPALNSQLPSYLYEVISYPHAKINLGLNVVSKRSDGYHNLETVFYPVQWCDLMEILPGPQHSKGIEVHMSGLPVAGKHADNLCVKAYELLRQYYSVRAVKLYLHKQIPMGAGLGGGSSDAAFFVKKMNELFSLGISDDDMRALVMKLGADCAFFIDGKPVFAEERGDKFTPIDFSLKGYHIAIVYPGIHVATSTAFANVSPRVPEYNCLDIVTRHPVAGWKELLSNDFEKTVFSAHPEIEAVKNRLYDAGAVYASMSGSGSAVFGLFESEMDVAKLFPGMSVWIGTETQD